LSGGMRIYWTLSIDILIGLYPNYATRNTYERRYIRPLQREA
jgi:hypothetical protein